MGSAQREERQELTLLGSDSQFVFQVFGVWSGSTVDMASKTAESYTRLMIVYVLRMS